MAATEPWRWRPPKGWSDNSSGLRLFSSYHNAVVPFVPAAGPDSRAVSWYACGPTVYEVIAAACLAAHPPLQLGARQPTWGIASMSPPSPRCRSGGG